MENSSIVAFWDELTRGLVEPCSPLEHDLKLTGYFCVDLP